MDPVNVPIHPPGEKKNWVAFHVLPANESVQYVKENVDKKFGDGLDVRNYDTKINWTKKSDYHMTLMYGFPPERYNSVTQRVHESGIRWMDLEWDGEPYFIIPHRPGSTNTSESGMGFWVQGVKSNITDEMRDRLINEFRPSDYNRVPLHVTIATVEYKIKPQSTPDNTANFIYRTN
jgi:hypothetical protein